MFLTSARLRVAAIFTVLLSVSVFSLIRFGPPILAEVSLMGGKSTQGKDKPEDETFLGPGGRAPVTVLRAENRGYPLVNLRDSKQIRTRFSGEAGIEESMTAGQSRSVSVRADDLNADGALDLVAGFSNGSSGGFLAVHQGSLDTLSARTPEVFEGLKEGRFPEPFLPEPKMLSIPITPDFIGSGDFNRDGAKDIVVMQLGESRAVLLLGNNGLRFEQIMIDLPGQVTAMTVGLIDPMDNLPDIAVAIHNGGQSSLLVYRGDRDTFRDAPDVYTLAAPASSLAIGQMDNGDPMDILVVGGGQAAVVYGSYPVKSVTDDGIVTEAPAGRLEQIGIGQNAVAALVGNFVWDRENRAEIALLNSDGTVHILERGKLDKREFTKAEYKARSLRHRDLMREEESRRNSDQKTLQARTTREKWSQSDSIKLTDSLSSTAISASTFSSARMTSYGVEDLLFVDKASQRVQMLLSRPEEIEGGYESLAMSVSGTRAAISLAVEGPAPAVVLPMRLSVMNRPGLVMLSENSLDVSYAIAAPMATFNVNTTADTYDGVCDANCSFRDALDDANAANTSDIIMLPAGIYTISPALGGPDQDTLIDPAAQASGDWDVFFDTTITGAGQATTILEAAAAQPGHDRVLDAIQTAVGIPDLTISGITIQNGRCRADLPCVDGGGLRYAVDNQSVLTISDSTITNNRTEVNTANPANNGGGIFGGQSDFVYTDLTVTNNTTAFVASGCTGATQCGGEGGGVFSGIRFTANPTSVTITNGTFTGNTANAVNGLGGRGGAYAGSPDSVSITGGTFNTNVAFTDAGALRLFTPTTISGSTISNNTARQNGGGIWSDPLANDNTPLTNTFTNVVMKGNTADSDGVIGANTVNRGDGGAIFHGRGTLHLNNPTIGGSGVGEGNTAYDGGGIARTYSQFTAAIFNASTLNINSGGSIVGNEAINNGGGIINDASKSAAAGNASTLNMTGAGAVTFTDNKARNHGGGIAVITGAGSSGPAAAANLNNMTLRSNQANSDNSGGGDGGGLYQNSGGVAGGGTTFTGTLTIGGAGFGNSAANGGGVSNVAGTMIFPANANITHNTATGNGGGVSTGGATTLNGTTFDANTAVNGSGLYQTGGTVTASNTINFNSGNHLHLVGGTFTSTSGTMNLTGNYTNSGGVFTHNGGTVIFIGNLTQSLGGTTSSTFNNLTINKSAGTLTLGVITPIAGNLTLTNGVFDLGAFTANRTAAGGTLTIADGTTLRIGGTGTVPSNFTTHSIGATSTIEYSGTNQTVATLNSVQNYGHLTTSGSGTKTLQGATVVRGNLIIGSGTVLAGGANSLNVAGNWTNNAGNSGFTSSATVTLNGTSQTVSGNTNFFNLTIAQGAGGTIGFGSTTTTVAGALSRTSGTTMDPGTGTFIFTGAAGSIIGSSAKTFHDLQINAGATISNTTGGNITVLNDYTNNGTFTQSAGIRTTFATGADGNHSLLGNGTTTFGKVLINGSNTVDAGSHNFSIVGNSVTTDSLEVVGTFTGNTSTVSFTGATAQTIAGNGTKNFAGLTINNAAGVTLNNGTGAVDASVSGALTLTTDLTVAVGGILQQSGTSAGAGDVIGTVRRTDLGATARAFGNPFNTIAIDAGLAPTQMDFNLVKSAPVDFATAILRNYTLTLTGGSGISATMSLHYNDTLAELNGNTESELTMWKKVSGTWAVQGRDAVDMVNKAVTLSEISSFSEWTLANRPDTTVTSITRDDTNPTNANTVSWSVLFANAVSDLSISNFTLDNAGPCSSPSISTVTADSAQPATSWTVTANTGTGSCTLRLDLANDNGVSHDVTNEPFITGEAYTIDKTPPTVLSSVLAGPNPTNAASVNFTVTFSESVSGVNAGDFSLFTTGVSGASVGTVSPAGPTNIYTVSVNTGSGDGTIRLDVTDDDSITDAATNPLGGTGIGNGNFNTGSVYTIDKTPPTVDITDVTPDPRNTAVGSITIVFSEAVTGFDLSDLTLTNGAGNLLTGAQTLTSGDNITWTLGNLSGLTGADGTYLLTLTAPGGIADGAGNALVTGATDSWVMDTTAPTVTINQASGQTDPTFVSPINFTAVFSEPVTDFDDAADIAMVGTTATASGGFTKTITEIAPNDGTTYNVAIGGVTGDGDVIVQVVVGAAQDAATNTSAASTSTDNTVTFVTCASNPVVTSNADTNTVGTLRYAITNICPAPNNNITFNLGAGANTITTTSTLVVGKDVTITNTLSGTNGPLTVNGNGGAFRIFQVDSPVTSATLSGFTISGGNEPTLSGGGLLVASGMVTLNGMLLTGNDAAFAGGGAAVQPGATLNVYNTTISGNTAQTASGGGLYNESGTLNLLNSTVTDNTAVSSGGGIHSQTNGPAPVTNVKNSIVSGNTAPTPADISGIPITDQGNNLNGVPAGLNVLADNGGLSRTHSLSAASPAINAGDNAAAAGFATDQRGTGFPRIGNTTVDIGAYETNFALAVSGGGTQSTAVNTNFGSQLQVTVTESGSPVSGVLVTFTATPAGNGASATFPGGNTATTNASGIASVQAAANTIAGTYQVTANIAATYAVTGVNFALTNTAGAANKLAFGQQPSNTVAGVSISPAVTVRVLDQFDNLVTTDTSNVTVAIGTNAGGGTLSGTATVAAVGGVATFSNLSINKTGTGYTLTAGASGLTGATSSAFNITPAAAAKLAFVQQPTNTVAGVSISPAVTVRVLDQFDNLVTTDTSNVTVAIGNNPGVGTLSGTATVAAVGGVATFSDLSINKTGTGYTLTAGASGLTGATSSAFNITPAAAAKLAFGQQPTNTAAGASITPAVTVRVLDQFDNFVANNTSSVTVAIETNPGGGTLSGTTTVSAVGGIATFSDLSINKTGTGYTLTGAAGALTGATSSAFNITPAAAAKLAFGQQPSDSAAGAAISPAVTVQVLDQFDNLVTTDTSNVTVAIGNNPGVGTLSGTATVAAVGGVATFNNLSINKMGTGYSLTAASGTLTGAMSSAFNITPAAPAKLVFGTQPSNTVINNVISPSVTVNILDAFDNQTTSNANVTMAIGTNPGGGTLSGTLTVAASSGTATFNDLSINLPGNGYTLAASSAGLTGATSDPFNLTCATNPVINNADTGAGSLRQVVLEACPGATIIFDMNTVVSPLQLDSGQIEIDKNLTIQGPGADLLTVQNTATPGIISRVFDIPNSSTVRITDLTVAGGNVTGSGLNGSGGGIRIDGGSVSLERMAIEGNTSAGAGGGILCNAGAVNITDSTISGNTASGSNGGGLQNNCSGPGSIVNSTVSGNTAGEAGGGIRHFAGSLLITNSTITNNTGGSGGSGVSQVTGTVTVRSTIIAGNMNNAVQPDVEGLFTSQGYNLIGNVGTATGFTATGDQTGTGGAGVLNPQLGSLQNNGGTTETHALAPTSPAVDKGSAFGLTTDQRGSGRPFDIPTVANAADGSDIGAYELNTVPTTTTVSSSNNPSVWGETVTFTATVETDPGGAPVTVGNVDFSLDGNPVAACQNVALNGSGQAQCAISGLALGGHTILAEYDENLPFLASSGSLAQTVNKANTTIQITGDTPDPTLIGDPYVVTWTVAVVAPGAGTPTGTVTITDGTGGTCTAPVATGFCTMTSTTVGVKNLVATYSGDAFFNGSVSAVEQHSVVIRISGTIRQAPGMTPLAGITVTLTGANGGGLALTNSNGDYTFFGTFSGNYTVTPSGPIPGKSYDPITRILTNVTGHTTGIDFVAYDTSTDAPRKLRVISQFAVPGSAVAVPVTIESQGNETSISFSIEFDPAIYSAPPTVGCGTDAGPGCTITTNYTQPGRVGIRVVPASVPLTAGTREIVKLNFQTQPTLASNTPIDLIVTPTNIAATNANGDLLLVELFSGGLIVMQQGLEGDVANSVTGDGQVLSNDVIVARQFAVGTRTANPAYNEFQRVDIAPAATKGDGMITSADVIQARRYASGIDAVKDAGGPFIPMAAAPPPAMLTIGEANRGVKAMPTNGVAGYQVTVPVEMKTAGDEMAVGFTLEYDAMKLGNPKVTLAGVAPADAVVTVNDTESGRLTILVDAGTPFSNAGGHLLNVTFDVAQTAPAGDTKIAIKSGSFSDAEANELEAAYASGTVTINGANAPSVSISGRVLTPTGGGLRNAQVTITDTDGSRRTVLTSSAGYYQFDAVAAGRQYRLSVSSRRYRFATRTVEISADLADIDFIAQE